MPEPDAVPPHQPAERRACVRYRCERLATGRAFISNSHKTLPARIVDLSVEGVGLLLEQPLEVGSRLSVDLEIFGSATFELIAEVVNIHPQPGGVWRCGCKLVWKLTEEDLRLLTK